MNQKRPLGVIIFSVVGILLGLGILIFAGMHPKADISILIVWLAFGGSFIVLHVGLFMMAKWARCIVLICTAVVAAMALLSFFLVIVASIFVVLDHEESYLAAMYLVVFPFGALFLGPFVLIGVVEFIYLTLAKIKEQFT